MSQSELSEADILTAVGAIVRRRNRVGAEDERGSIATSCEQAATMLVVNAMREGGFTLSRATADRGGEVEPSDAEVEAAIVAEADAINRTHGDPGHAVHWPDDFTPDEQHCRREGMRAALTAAARIRSALATTAGEDGKDRRIATLTALLSELVERDLTYDGGNIVVPLGSHGNAIGLVARVRAALVTDKG